MLVKEKNRIIEQLRSIRNDENNEIINDAIYCIHELDSERRSLLSAFEDCGNRLREVSIENSKLKGFI